MTGKTQKSVVSTRVDAGLISDLDALCHATERDRSYHVERALKDYVERNLWQVRAVQEGIADVEAGRVKPLDTVVEKWEARKLARNTEV